MTRNHILAVVLVGGTLACSGPVDVGTTDRSKKPAAAVASYMGQAPPSTEAVVFAPGSVSIEGRYEYAVSIHPDGDRLLFTAEVPDHGASVFLSRLENGAWTTPRRLSLTDDARKSEMEAFFAPDGSRIFFAPFDDNMDVRIWSAEVTPDGFRDPHPLAGPVAADPSFYPVQATDGSLYYTNLAQRAIYRATMANGEVTGAGAAGLERGGHAFPAPDGSFMVLDSASLDATQQRDIFVASRNDDGTWGPPRPLGPEVNTEYSETCPSLSPDGQYLFFSRYNEPHEISNIYWVSSAVIAHAAPADGKTVDLGEDR